MEYLEWFRGQQRIAKTGSEGVKERYSRVVVDLNEAREDTKINISGDYLAIAKSTGTSSTTYFKLNHRNSRKIYPNEIEKLYASYKAIYLTNASEDKEIVMYVGGALAGEIKVASAGKTQLKNACGVDINPATEDTLSDIETNLFDGSVDTIMLRFNGKPYSTPITSTNAVQRFNGTNPKKIADIVIRNIDAANPVDIGLYNATVATLRAASFELTAGSSIGFTKVDLYQLGIVSSTDGNHAVVQVLGVETY